MTALWEVELKHGEEIEDGPRNLVAYRHATKNYRKVKLDQNGRLPLKPLNLSLGLKDDKVVLFDSVTGEEQQTYSQIAQARQAAEKRRLQETKSRKAAEKRLRELEAEIQRLRQGRTD